MAEFRKNHSVLNSGPIAKLGVLVLLLGGLYYLFGDFLGNNLDMSANRGTSNSYEKEENTSFEQATATQKNYLPSTNKGQIVAHQYYTISYSEEDEQPEWVAYELKKEQLVGKRVERDDNFRPDSKVKTKSADLSDYRGSGYDRGHLVPAGDMGFNERAMSETFFMSNMSPQVRNFNGGIWRELEESTRDWAIKYKHLYVVSGPVLTVRKLGTIGRNEVTIPSEYYKVLLDATEPELKGIGFIIPNKVSDEHLSKFAVTIDEVETLTGIDFFPNLLPPNKEEELEGSFEVGAWKFSEKRYKQRVDSWNNR